MTTLRLRRFTYTWAGLSLAALGALGVITLDSASAEAPVAAPVQTTRADITRTLGFVPGFFRVMSDAAVAGAWEEMKGLQMNPNTALNGRTKELIGLAVAAQIPCHYCVMAHSEFAKLNGASEAELAEAVAIGGVSRHWSTFIFGAQIDKTKHRAEVARMLSARTNANAAPIQVTDAASALRDIERSFGFVPEWLRKVPESALPGAWRELKDLRLSATTIAPKHKALIALAVAAQASSEACVATETSFATAAGATEREIAEAIGMAAITRNMSTMLNGQQIDAQGFAADIRRLVEGAKAAVARAR